MRLPPAQILPAREQLSVIFYLRSNVQRRHWLRLRGLLLTRPIASTAWQVRHGPPNSPARKLKPNSITQDLRSDPSAVRQHVKGLRSSPYRFDFNRGRLNSSAAVLTSPSEHALMCSTSPTFGIWPPFNGTLALQLPISCKSAGPRSSASSYQSSRPLWRPLVLSGLLRCVFGNGDNAVAVARGHRRRRVFRGASNHAAACPSEPSEAPVITLLLAPPLPLCTVTS